MDLVKAGTLSLVGVVVGAATVLAVSRSRGVGHDQDVVDVLHVVQGEVRGLHDLIAEVAVLVQGERSSTAPAPVRTEEMATASKPIDLRALVDAVSDLRATIEDLRLAEKARAESVATASMSLHELLAHGPSARIDVLESMVQSGDQPDGQQLLTKEVFMMSPAEVVHRMGAPTSCSADCWIWELRNDGTDLAEVQVFFKNGYAYRAAVLR